jgi:hypothetical protein
MKYIWTNSENYKKFLESNLSNRLSKGLKVIPSGDKWNLFKISRNLNEEIFNNPLETKYSINKLNDRFLKIKFGTNSDRLDIHMISEFGIIINHISFTEDSDKYDKLPNSEESYIEYELEYSKPTNKNEMIELMNRIHFILLDVVDKGILSTTFSIGGTELEEKNRIYEYFLKVLGVDFKKLKTDVYPKCGWALYFSI